LWLLAFLPAKNLLSDFAIMVAATGFVVSHHVFSTTEGEDGFHHAEIVVLFSVAAAGIHSLILLAYVIIVFTLAPYVASHYDTSQLLGCIYILVVSGICEFQVADFAWRTGWHSQLPHKRQSHISSRGSFLTEGDVGYKAMLHSHISRDGGMSYDGPAMSRQGYRLEGLQEESAMHGATAEEEGVVEDNWRSFAPPGSAHNLTSNEFGHTRRAPMDGALTTSNLSLDSNNNTHNNNNNSNYNNNSSYEEASHSHANGHRGKENSDSNEISAGRSAHALADPGLLKAANSWVLGGSSALNSKMLESGTSQSGARLPRPTGTPLPDLVLPRVGLQETTDLRSLPSAGVNAQRRASRLEDTQVKQPTAFQQAPSPREPSPEPPSSWPVGTKTVAREKAPAKWEVVASPSGSTEALLSTGKLSQLFKKKQRAPSPSPQKSPTEPPAPPTDSTHLAAPSVVAAGTGSLRSSRTSDQGPELPTEESVRAIKLTGFEIPGLSDTYVEDSSIEFMVNGRETYWSSSGDYFLYRNDQGNTWALAKAKRFTDVRSGDNSGGVAYAPEGFDIWSDGPSSSVRKAWHEFDSRSGKWKKSEASGVESRGKIELGKERWIR